LHGVYAAYAFLLVGSPLFSTSMGGHVIHANMATHRALF